MAKSKNNVIDFLGKKLVSELRKEPGYRSFDDAHELQKNIGAEIARVRKARRMSVAELAKRIGKKQQAVQRMEKGDYKQYTYKLLLEIAGALDSKITFKLS
ncbi:MAG: hypothetical protein C5B54_11110 [Acidobacteria bacterium]|nr:MAG: hypothetical protein C5B54_11110 [Acidobacteriota bacterium]